MKNAVLTIVALGALSAAASAQTEYVWVTNRGSNSVVVYDIANPNLPLANPIAIDGEPYGIVGIPASRRVYVSYSQTVTRDGKVAVIDSDAFQIINIVPIAGSNELRRMCLSRDKARLYVCGRTPSPMFEGAVWSLGIGANPDNPSVSFVSSAPGSNGPAEDVTEVAASAVGGSGSGPGKIYYTVPGVAVGVLFQHNFLTPATSGPLTLNNANLPWGLDRSPDDRFVVVGVNELVTPQWKVVQIVTGATDSVFDRQILPITGPSRTWDVAIATGPGPTAFTVYALGLSSGNYNMFTRDMDPTGYVGSVPVQSGNLQPPNFRSLVLNVSPFESQLYMGNDASGPADIAFGRSGSPIPNTGGWNPAGDGGAGGLLGPTDFAFMPQPPAPQVVTMCPKGAVDAIGNEIVVTAKNVFPGSFVRIPGGSGPVAIPTTYVNSTTLRATIDQAMIAGENDILVTNPDGQTSILQSFYAACGPAVTTFPMTFPSLSQGYRMVSVPAYYTKAMLRQALASSLGPYNRSRYRVFFWKGSDYVELSEFDDEDCDLCGGAFWILTTSGGMGSIDAIDALTNHTSADIRVIPLQPGWNMVSNPFVNGPLVNMVWASITVTADPVAWTGATPADTSPDLSPLFEYVNGSYQAVGTMVAGRGYFVKNIDPSNRLLYLLVITTNVSKPSAGSPPVSYSAGGFTPPPPPGGSLGSDGGSSGGCGLAGPELLLLLLGRRAFQRLRRRRTLAA